MKQTGNSWPPPLQMFGCEGSLSPGITGTKPPTGCEPTAGQWQLLGSDGAAALLPRPSVPCPATFWGGRREEAPQSEQINPVGLALRVPGLSGAHRATFCSYSSSTWRGIGRGTRAFSGIHGPKLSELFWSCGKAGMQHWDAGQLLPRSLQGWRRNLSVKSTRQSIFLPGASLTPGKLKG